MGVPTVEYCVNGYTPHSCSAFTCHVGCAAVELESNSKSKTVLKGTAGGDACVCVQFVVPSACELFRRREQLVLSHGAAIRLRFPTVRYCCYCEHSNRQVMVTVVFRDVMTILISYRINRVSVSQSAHRITPAVLFYKRSLFLRPERT